MWPSIPVGLAPYLPYLILGAMIIAAVSSYFLRHILGGMVGLYRVVPVNEAHIRILRHKKDIFSTREGKSA